MNKGNTKHQVNDTYFDNIDTQEKAYWLGFIMADGCVYKQKPTYRFQINLKETDREILERFNKTVGSDYKIIDKMVRSYRVSQLKINSKSFCESLIKYGVVPRKSGNEKIPDIDPHLIRHFLRGYFDGDGSLVLG